MKIIYSLSILMLAISIVLTIQSYNLIYSVFWLIISFCISSFLIFLKNLIELSLFILMIYGGAISIMFVFAIMMVNLNKYGKYKLYNLDSILLLLMVGAIIMFNCFIIGSINNNEFAYWSQLVEYTDLLNNLSFVFYISKFSLLIASALLLLIPMINVLIIIKC